MAWGEKCSRRLASGAREPSNRTRRMRQWTGPDQIRRLCWWIRASHPPVSSAPRKGREQGIVAAAGSARRARQHARGSFDSAGGTLWCSQSVLHAAPQPGASPLHPRPKGFFFLEFLHVVNHPRSGPLTDISPYPKPLQASFDPGVGCRVHSESRRVRRRRRMKGVYAF